MINEFNRCWACMEPLEAGQDICPKCQFQNAQYQRNPRCLKPGTKLRNRFFVGKVLGEGGFGITYIGWDSILDMPVAVKEYFPATIASRDCTTSLTDDIHVFEGKAAQTYQQGLERYLREARTLSKFHDLHGVVDIRDFFEANNTAYMVMEYLKGPTLEEYMERHGRMKPEYVFQIMKPVMRSLEKIHQAGMVHRDISPDNIMLSEGSIKLIDFGAARLANNDTNKSLTIVLKRGFAPEEQYRTNGKQGPWTDVYAISATMYYMLTGQKPPESIGRSFEDSLPGFAQLGVSLPKKKENAILKGLAPRWQMRYQSIQELCDDLYEDTSTITPSQQIDAGDEDLQNIVTEEEMEEKSQQEVEQAVEHSVQLSEQREREKPSNAEKESVLRRTGGDISGQAELAAGEEPAASASELPGTVLMDMGGDAEEKASEIQGTVLMDTPGGDAEAKASEIPGTVLMDTPGGSVEAQASELPGTVLMDMPGGDADTEASAMAWQANAADFNAQSFVQPEKQEGAGYPSAEAFGSQDIAGYQSADGFESQSITDYQASGGVGSRDIAGYQSAENFTGLGGANRQSVNTSERLSEEDGHGNISVERQPQAGKKKLAAVCGILGVIVVIALGGVFLYQKKNAAPSSDDQNVASTEKGNDGKQQGDSSVQETAEPTEQPVETVEMVNVKNKTEKAAKKAIQALGDSSISLRTASKYSDSVKKGSVISQSLSAGKTFEKGTKQKITLVISKGSKPVKVPALVGKSKEKAIKMLHKKGLKYRIVAYRYTTSYAKGKVMKQRIAAGKKVKKGKMIGIVISDGTKPVTQTSQSSAGSSSYSGSSGSSSSGSSSSGSSGSSSSGSKSSGSSGKSRPAPISGGNTRPDPIS